MELNQQPSEATDVKEVSNAMLSLGCTESQFSVDQMKLNCKEDVCEHDYESESGSDLRFD